ncbi:serine/threonine-protein phosphatase 6 regulatory ankyrin repeat subunit C, partial [Exaiptasia diaphana]|uniref:Protein kinase domain-containing protein n=1 Tax=Exaiptasia diaphana TaxID=2652724 RepID=A0A913WVD4_EXADI
MSWSVINLYDNSTNTSALIKAIFDGNNELSRELITQGEDPNVRDDEGRTPLMCAAFKGNKEIAEILIDAGSEVNQRNHNKQTALFHSIANNNEVVARLLALKRADVNVSDIYRQTPLLSAAENDNKEVARLLIEKGADVNVSDKDGQTPLFSAAKNDNKEVARLLIEKGADVNVSDMDGQTPLFSAAQYDNEKVARLLIEKGADINVSDNDKITPLFSAATNNNEEVARLLIEKGADVNVSNKDGQTPLFSAATNNNEEVARLLIEKGADVNVSNKDGQTPLFSAATNNNEEVARLLIEKGADVNVCDKHGRTPLFNAAGQTPLFSAATNNNEEVARLLIEKGADVNVCDKHGRTPLFNAVNARDMYGRTAMFSAATTIDDSKMFEVIATMLVRKGGVVDDTDNKDMSVLSYFVERHCCNSFKDNRNVSKRLSFFIKNGIRNSAIFTSALSYLYATLPNYFYSSNTVDRREMFLNAISVAYTYASHEVQSIDTLNALLDDERIPEAMDLMVMLGVNPNCADSYGNTALHYATLLPFHGVSQENAKKILETLRNHGIRTNIKNQEKETPLHFCLSEQAWKLASEKDTWSGIMTVVEICEFLLQDGSLISETTRNGKTVYHLIMELLSHGLSMNDVIIRDVICSSSVKLLKMFSKITGEDLNVLKKMDHKLKSPLHLWASLSLPPNQKYYRDPLTKGFTFQVLLDSIFKHLWKPGMSPNPRNDQDQTPLHLCKTWTATRLLIEAGAKANDVDGEGQTPLLNVAKQKQFKIKQGYLFPDVEEDPKQFFETCVSLGLDIWSSDNEGQSMLSIFLDSEAYALANGLIDVAVANCKSTTIVKQLLDAICKDQSTSTTWKSLLTLTLITSPQLASSTNLDGSLRHICTNIEKEVLGQKQEQRVGIEEGNESEEPPNKRPRIVDTENRSTPKSNVIFDIGRQLLFYGADGNSLCNDFPNLHSFLTAVITPDQMKEIIPWTSHSTIHEEKLRAVSRKQNVAEIGTYYYHEEPIGKGGFGDVYAGIGKNDGREVAIKKIKRSQVKGQDKREISNLVELADCPQVVKYISFDVSDKHFVFIVLELMEGHLDDYFPSPSFDASRRPRLCRDVVQGLAYLHQHEPKPILHRDLKPENILYKFDKDGKVIVKIADFGLSSPLTTGRTTVLHSKVGTRCW